jgi:hypothetical protein
MTGVRSPTGAANANTFRTYFWPIQPPNRKVPGSLSPRFSRPKREAGPSNAVVYRMDRAFSRVVPNAFIAWCLDTGTWEGRVFIRWRRAMTVSYPTMKAYRDVDIKPEAMTVFTHRSIWNTLHSLALQIHPRSDPPCHQKEVTNSDHCSARFTTTVNHPVLLRCPRANTIS